MAPSMSAVRCHGRSTRTWISYELTNPQQHLDSSLPPLGPWMAVSSLHADVDPWHALTPRCFERRHDGSPGVRVPSFDTAVSAASSLHSRNVATIGCCADSDADLRRVSP